MPRLDRFSLIVSFRPKHEHHATNLNRNQSLLCCLNFQGKSIAIINHLINGAKRWNGQADLVPCLPLCILLFHCFVHLGSWARNVGLSKQTACQWHLLQQQCQELITLWPICKHYITHDTSTFNPYKYQSSFLDLTTPIVSCIIWSGILEESIYQVWRT